MNFNEQGAFYDLVGIANGSNAVISGEMDSECVDYGEI